MTNKQLKFECALTNHKLYRDHPKHPEIQICKCGRIGIGAQGGYQPCTTLWWQYTFDDDGNIVATDPVHDNDIIDEYEDKYYR